MLLIDMDSRSFSVCGIRKWRGGESDVFSGCDERAGGNVDREGRKTDFFFLLLLFSLAHPVLSPTDILRMHPELRDASVFDQAYLFFFFFTTPVR